ARGGARATGPVDDDLDLADVVAGVLACVHAGRGQPRTAGGRGVGRGSDEDLRVVEHLEGGGADAAEAHAERAVEVRAEDRDGQRRALAATGGREPGDAGHGARR